MKRADAAGAEAAEEFAEEVEAGCRAKTLEDVIAIDQIELARLEKKSLTGLKAILTTVCFAASRFATSSMAGERSTAVTDPTRRAKGIASRPGPQPYSRTNSGLKSGASFRLIV